MTNNNINNVYIGFDFSMNKPAATVYYNKKFYFYFWPLNLTEKKITAYHNCGVNVHTRNLKSIDTKNTDNSQLVLIHTIRSIDLANMIIEDLNKLITETLSLSEYNLYVCSEGLSYSSRGDATLNLATYKGVLLAKIYEFFDDKLKRLFTYAPTTLKATANCATKEKKGNKLAMIAAFIDSVGSEFPLSKALLSGELTSKTNFFEGVDDIVDSYWALRTMIKKEKLAM